MPALVGRLRRKLRDCEEEHMGSGEEVIKTSNCIEEYAISIKKVKEKT